MNARHASARVRHAGRRSRGFTLIELMVAMLLGLIVIAGVSSVFLANLRSYHSNTALSDVQSNARIAFTMMARDIRQAGLTGCNSRSGRVANVLQNGPNNGGTTWWADWNNAVLGFGPDAPDTTYQVAQTGTGTGELVAGTDSLMLIGASGTGLSVQSDHEPAANFKLNAPSSDLETGDVIMVCDPDHATIVQITDYNNSTVTVVHNAGGSVSPGNCSKGLGFPTVCTTNGDSYTFEQNSMISKLAAEYWYIGNNSVGGRSLYRVSVSNPNNAQAAQPQEMVRGVTDMQITYHQGGTAALADQYVDAGNVTDWSLVNAVHITYTLKSSITHNTRVGTNQQRLQRTFAATISIRNRT